MKKKDYYLTPGELASLYGISKQTLLYYDKTELLTPAFVNEKGYRYYSVSQYHTLEIILNLRKLNISVQAIKDYLQRRDLENLEQILLQKEQECDIIIADMLQIKNSLQNSLKALKKTRKVKLEQIELKVQEEQTLFVSEKLTDHMTIKERIKLFSRHSQNAFSQKHFREFTSGWVLDKDDFFAQKFNKTLQYFTPVSHSFSKKHCFVRPEGLYLSICFAGTYYQKATVAYEKIQTFIRLNHLSPIGDIYVFPLKNHWMTENTSAYINEISFQVEYQS